MRYVPIDLAASIAAGEEHLASTDIYTQRFNDYFRCDVRISFKQNLGKVSQEWGLDLQNVSNYKNIFAQQYNKYSESIATVYQQGFMPMMMYRIHF
ncbi:MAG TPA: insecticidal delta-endotoxin Cry8Ea1 family protein [Paludibacteraceae bacterium]|nr:insecticidal delta-endotoxin Cry8Ea1 family protein [Paludibacteraceae bacterium]